MKGMEIERESIDMSGKEKDTNRLVENLSETIQTSNESQSIKGLWQWVTIVLSAIGLFLVVDHVFYFGLLGKYELQSSYSYFLMAIFISTAFFIYPGKRGVTLKGRYFLNSNVLLFLITICLCTFFGLRAYEMQMKGWGAMAPMHMIVLSAIIWFIILEATRRAGGTAMFLVALLISLYPLIAEYMPGMLKGAGFSFESLIAYHIMSPDSALGIPIVVVGNILLGYLIFGITLVETGGGEFFFKISMALLGHARGGVAKVATLASAFFGSLSGSAISNVITTGTMTIPMMKKTGFPAYYAGAVEACASNGGTLMPPVMGAVAFVMASFLNVPYLTVALTAVVPSFLYYLGLLIQVDGYAAYNGLKGLPKSELPSIKKTLKEGWFYVFSIIILVAFVFFRMETQAPFYTSLFLLLVANVRKKTRFNLKKIKKFLHGIAEVMTQLVPLLCAVGMIIGSLGMTGVAHAFPSEILHYAGGNIVLLLVLGGIVSFLLGMGMSAITVYVFLAIMLAPALVKAGLNEIAVHFFILYWGILSYITPPVCVAVYPAAAIAGARPMKTGWTAARLGSVKYFIPIFFVLNPALILQGPLFEIIYSVSLASIGVFFIASSFEGYLLGFGGIKMERAADRLSRYLFLLLRIGIFVVGFLLAMPESKTDIAGALIFIPLIIIMLHIKRRAQREISIL
jgi:TRAP transporter 4TM/12TM fusion protein